MSKLNIACLISPMADTEGPMEIVDGKLLTGPKKIMGKYGEIGLEAAITFGEEHPDATHLSIFSAGQAKEIQSLQQSAIAMIQPKKHPAELAVHALELDDIDQRDGFAVADLLVAMIRKQQHQPDLLFVGRESWDYAHGVVGPAVAQKLGMPYYSGVNEIKVNDDLQSVTATFIEGNDKLVYNVALPAVFGTTDWLNGKDSARFTSLKGVMMAKKFARNTLSLGDLEVDGGESRTVIDAIEPVKSERKNRVLQGDEGPQLAQQAYDILIKEDKALTPGSGSGDNQNAGDASVSWAETPAGGLDFSGDIVLLADHDGTSVRLSTRQALSQARKVADSLGKNVTLVLLAHDPAGLASGCLGHGADRVVAIVGEQFKHQGNEAVITHLTALFNASKPAHFMTVANDLGRDVAATMATSFGGGLLQDVVGLDVKDGNLHGRRIVSNARFETSERILAAGPSAISVRATAFDPEPRDGEPSFHQVTGLEAAPLRGQLTEVVAGEKTKGIPLNEAKIIVSGGRGMKAAENFAKLDELADLLGGTVGASRAVTDLEWVPHNLQIGQTGTTVAPDVYFAIGISGAIQHLTGMLGAKYIVAVNPDAEAPIHKHADLSIIDKWENVIPAFTDQVRQGL